jgi:tetratricopeptide (TPR) repeat protein
LEQHTFYEKLDGLYAAGERLRVERFLLETEEQCRAQSDVAGEITVLNEMGSYYRGVSRYEQSIDAFGRAKEAIARMRGKESLDYAVNILNLAGTYRMQHDTEKALSLFEEAMQICRALGVEQDGIYASVLNNMALAQQDREDLADAEQNMQQALALLREIPGSEVEQATTLTNLAALYEREKRYEDAALMVEESLGVYRQTGNTDNPHYAAALHQLAWLRLRSGASSEAIELYRDSMQRTEQGCGRNVDYAVTSMNLGHALQMAGRTEDAVQSWHTAAEILSGISGAEALLQRVREQLERAGATYP